jgi:hypothetical protein
VVLGEFLGFFRPKNHQKQIQQASDTVHHPNPICFANARGMELLIAPESTRACFLAIK